MATISIIIPVYNVEAYLRECLDSVLVDNKFTGQVVCVNDGSTDGSGKILEEYKKQYPNVELYSQENQGQSVARNMGLDKAKGDYILFLDSDDYYRKGALDYLERLIEKNPEVDYFYMDGATTDNGTRFYSLPYEESVIKPLREYFDYEYATSHSNPMGCLWGGMYKREFIEENHLRMLPNCRYEDELFIFEVFMKQGICMALHVEEPYYYYRVGREGATTARYTLMHFFNRRTVIHACYESMKANSLQTEARKRKVFEMCEENILQAYLFGFDKDIKKFFTKEDVRILKECATTERDEKLVKLAKVSPKLLAAYRTENLPIIMRKCINRWF